MLSMARLKCRFRWHFLGTKPRRSYLLFDRCHSRFFAGGNLLHRNRGLALSALVLTATVSFAQSTATLTAGEPARL